jgi:ubiquinone/menaquinone biosynthesis C-methylase UbiE
VDEGAILGHYGTGYERQRLFQGTSRIEFERTKELLQRFLPTPPAAVIDIGGGPGAYAAWLAEHGFTVHLIDPVPVHVEDAVESAQFAEFPFTASLGDARRLEAPDSSYDVALMLGPLYHLTDRGERLQALTEAQRVTRPGGLVVAAAISRFASLMDGLRNGYLADPAFQAIVERDLTDGQHRNPDGRTEWFTTAYFHHPDELSDEMREAGLRLEALFGVEGPGWLMPELWDEPQGRANILRAARAVEEEPALLGVSAHLLAVARTPIS